MALEHSGGNCAALATTADDRARLSSVQLRETRFDSVEGHMHRACDMAFLPLTRLTHIEHKQTCTLLGQLCHTQLPQILHRQTCRAPCIHPTHQITAHLTLSHNC